MPKPALNAPYLSRMLERYFAEHSRHDPVRDYLGMSQIHRKHDQLVAMMQRQARGHARTFDTPQLLRFGLGYLFQDYVLDALYEKGVLVEGSEEREIVATFDARFRGHIDGELKTGAVFDIKSTTQDHLNTIRLERRCPDAHYAQMQCYLRHGDYASGMLIYIARDTGRIWAHFVRPDAKTQDLLDEKARRVLAAVDALQSADVTTAADETAATVDTEDGHG